MRGESGEENLDFSPVGVGQACFSLATEPPTAPQRAGFSLRPPGGKKGRTGAFRLPGGATGPFFGAGAEQVAWGGLLGARLEMP